MQTATLQISRLNQSINKLVRISIYLDGKFLYALANNETKSFQVEAGQHFLTAKIDWCRSYKLTVTLIPGQTILLETGSPIDYNPKPISWVWDLFFLFAPIVIGYYFGDGIILWIALVIILVWLLWLLFIKKQKPLLYYITFGYKEYVFLRLVD